MGTKQFVKYCNIKISDHAHLASSPWGDPRIDDDDGLEAEQGWQFAVLGNSNRGYPPQRIQLTRHRIEFRIIGLAKVLRFQDLIDQRYGIGVGERMAAQQDAQLYEGLAICQRNQLRLSGSQGAYI